MRKVHIVRAVLALASALVACDRTASSDSSNTSPSSHPGAPVMQPTSSPSARDNAGPHGEGALPEERRLGTIETVATFDRWMPTGVAVSKQGRMFVNFPRWGDPLEMSVAELKNGQPSPYPNPAWNPAQPGDGATTFTGVQSVFVDAKDRLWVLDTGTVNMAKVTPGAAKLVGFDLTSNKAVTTIVFPSDVALPTSYLNDVRFDLRRGKGGFAYISDSSFTGPNAIVVVDLDAGKSWRRLIDHPSVKPQPGFLAIVEGEPLYKLTPGQQRAPFAAGVDGIEISPDGKTLYYCPLASRRLYSASVDALSDPSGPDGQVAATVKDLGDKGASDGMLMASDGRLYVTAYEGNAILRRALDGTLEPVATDTRMLWPDSMALGPDGALYVTVNQLDRQPMFHGGQDLRQRPYAVLRIHPAR